MPRSKGKKALKLIENRGPSGPQTNPAKGKVILQALMKAGSRNIAPRGSFRKVNPRYGAAKGGFTSRRKTAYVATTNIRRNRGPKLNGRTNTIISHSEYLFDLNGSTAFVTTSVPINPGLISSFPWLANIATQYEEYRFKRLFFRFETEASTQQKGSVILVTDYDALDSNFQNKQQAMAYVGATRSAAWAPLKHKVGGKAGKALNQLFVRSGANPAGSDLKTYDLGNFQVCTSGFSDGTAIGEIYVDYEIELIGPKTNNVLGQTLPCADIRGASGLAQANPLGVAPQQVAGSNIVVNVNGTTVTFGTSGRLLCMYQANGTGITGIGITTSGGAVAVTNYGQVFTATSCMTVVSIDYTTNSGQGIVLTVPSTTITAATLFVSQISSGLLDPMAPKKAPRGMPLYLGDDPVQKKLAELEALLAQVKHLACPSCGQFGTHVDSCRTVRSSSLMPGVPTGF